MFQPAIKWSGSKRNQVDTIIKYIPKTIDTYYEPFCGGCSVLRGVLESNIIAHNYVCSDLNSDLIALWKCIKGNPLKVYQWYEQLWLELNKDDDLERKKQYFFEIRERLNTEHNPLDFMFIMRTTTNGMPRYNASGDFNNSFHVTRNGIEPNTLYKILDDWSYLLNKFNVQFECCSFDRIQADTNDFLYLDPPYANTKGMYYGSLKSEDLFEWLIVQPCKYVLSYDGVSGGVDNTVDVPTDIYTKHIYLTNGNSSFKRVLGKSKDAQVQESLYIK